MSLLDLKGEDYLLFSESVFSKSVFSESVFFQFKDDIYPVTCQIRETTLGTPNSKILAYSEVELTPDFVNISEDGWFGKQGKYYVVFI